MKNIILKLGFVATLISIMYVALNEKEIINYEYHVIYTEDIKSENEYLMLNMLNLTSVTNDNIKETEIKDVYEIVDCDKSINISSSYNLKTNDLDEAKSKYKSKQYPENYKLIRIIK